MPVISTLPSQARSGTGGFGEGGKPFAYDPSELVPQLWPWPTLRRVLFDPNSSAEFRDWIGAGVGHIIRREFNPAADLSQVPGSQLAELVEDDRHVLAVAYRVEEPGWIMRGFTKAYNFLWHTQQPPSGFLSGRLVPEEYIFRPDQPGPAAGPAD